VRQLPALPAIDGRAWIAAGGSDGGTHAAPNGQFSVILEDDPANSGEVLRFKVFFAETGRPRVELNPGLALYAWISPDSRWIFIDPLDAIDVRTWRRFPVLEHTNRGFVVIHAISQDGKRLLITEQDCPFDCPIPRKNYEVAFP
jgi:hypothetical protein